MKSKRWQVLFAVGVVLTLILVASAAYYLVSAANETNEKYTPTLPIDTVNQSNHQEIATILLNQWLSHFKSSMNIHDRLDSYEVHDIHVRDAQDDGFVLAVSFSVKPMIDCSGSSGGALCSGWIVGNGTREKDGWIRDKFLFFQVIKKTDAYKLQMLGTSP